MIRLAQPSPSGVSLLPDLTPLLDVIFIVLVFFLLTAQTPLLELPMQMAQSQETLEPAVASGERMHIQLDEQGNWRFNATDYDSFAALRSQLLSNLGEVKAAGLDIALDRRAPLTTFLDLMAMLQQHGIEDSRILLEPVKDAP